jgi:hypothetical protein
MRFQDRRYERKLERRLRAERPQASDELVLLNAGPAAARVSGSRFRAFARFALVVAVTLALVSSLVAAGATGYAKNSLGNLRGSLEHVLRAPRGSSNSQSESSTGSVSVDPFQIQHGLTEGVCEDKNLIQVPFQEIFYLLLHGDQPPSSCSPRD